jgi:hypothetical protein
VNDDEDISGLREEVNVERGVRICKGITTLEMKTRRSWAQSLV